MVVELVVEVAMVGEIAMVVVAAKAKLVAAGVGRGYNFWSTRHPLTLYRPSAAVLIYLP